MVGMTKCPRCWGTGLEPPRLTLPCGYCAGLQQVEDVHLSEHFLFGEWCRAREGCSNDPPPEAVERARNTLQYLVEPARAALGVAFRVTSGYRCPQLDVIADSGNPIWLTRLSAHALGSAFDLQAPPHSLRELTEVLRKNAKAAWDQIILEGGCVHAALEGPDEHGHALPPGAGRRRSQILIRRLRVVEKDGPGSKFKYDTYTGTEEQMKLVV